jgi:uncharacterized protein
VSYALDVNVLLYASNTDEPEHQRAAAFLESCARNDEVCCLAWPTVMGYLRMATHPRIFMQPLSPQDAMENIERLLARPQVRVLAEDDRFWSIYRDITRTVPTRGNLVPDAHLAALLKSHGVRVLYTRDRDFLKFPFLQVRDPFA